MDRLHDSSIVFIPKSLQKKPSITTWFDLRASGAEIASPFNSVVTVPLGICADILSHDQSEGWTRRRQAVSFSLLYLRCSFDNGKPPSSVSEEVNTGLNSNSFSCALDGSETDLQSVCENVLSETSTLCAPTLRLPRSSLLEDFSVKQCDAAPCSGDADDLCNVSNFTGFRWPNNVNLRAMRIIDHLIRAKNAMKENGGGGGFSFDADEFLNLRAPPCGDVVLQAYSGFFDPPFLSECFWNYAVGLPSVVDACGKTDSSFISGTTATTTAADFTSYADIYINDYVRLLGDSGKILR